MANKQTKGKSTLVAAKDNKNEGSVKQSDFYFSKRNYKFMFIGLAFILIGFLLMIGKDANTTPEGNYDPNYWNEGINSIRRIRIAPLLVIIGFVIQIYAILTRKKD